MSGDRRAIERSPRAPRERHSIASSHGKLHVVPGAQGLVQARRPRHSPRTTASHRDLKVEL